MRSIDYARHPSRQDCGAISYSIDLGRPIFQPSLSSNELEIYLGDPPSGQLTQIVCTELANQARQDAIRQIQAASISDNDARRRVEESITLQLSDGEKCRDSVGRRV